MLHPNFVAYRVLRYFLRPSALFSARNRQIRSNNAKLYPIIAPHTVVLPKSVLSYWSISPFRNHVTQSTDAKTRPETKRRCWKCNMEMDRLSLHCERADCGAIQAFPGDVTYFELMGIGEDDGARNQPTYDIDMGELRRNFLTLQQRVHPDSYSQKDQKEYAYAQQQSSMINKAYQTLRDPIERSLYMLELNDVTIDESESVDDPELLMEVLEAREQLEDASNEDEAKTVQDESEARMNSLVEDISKAFKNRNYLLAKKLTIQLRYWNNIRNAARY